MAIEILMPALSPTMTEGTIAKWLKKEGDSIKPGEVIAEIETDKAIMEIESIDKGKLGKILVAERAEGVKVNALIAVLLEEGDTAHHLEEIIKKHSATGLHIHPTHIINNEVENQSHILSPSQKIKEDRIIASPLAKRIAQIENIDLRNIKGSGPHGRIVKADLAHRSCGSATYNDLPLSRSFRNPEEFSIAPLSQMRKVIAKRLLESKQNIPHCYLNIECNLNKLLALREEINGVALEIDGKPLYKISVNDFMIKAAASALKEYPKINVSFTDEGMRYYNNIDISIAVAIDDGLITPIIRNVDQKSLTAISSEMKELVKRAKDHNLKPEEFQGGGFSITNLGMFGIKHFNAIVNPPQSAILAIGSSEERAIVHNGQISIANMVSISLSCDHRAIDGALAAMFLSKLKMLLETPTMMLI